MAQGGYTKEMDRIIASLEGRPRLLLHACCAPCSSAVLELLDRHFELTIFYYNPNIAPDEEYHRREQELEYILWPRRQARINGIAEPGRSAFSGKLCCMVFSN